MPKRAVLLVNLGSPDSTAVPDVRRYLNEFLGDERVIDKPRSKLLRTILVNGIITPFRSPKSAEAYKQIWTAEGSPLVVTSFSVQKKLAAELSTEVPVYLAMRYGNPSVASVLAKMAADGITDILLFPQYPHYAMSSWETVVIKVQQEAAVLPNPPHIETVQPFYEDADYIEALYQVSAPYLAQPHDMLLVSYHSIPQRHLREADSSHAHCTLVKDCCDTCSPLHATCYKAQVLKTTQAFVKRAGISADKHTVSFQSRLAGEPWITPYTDFELKRLPQDGKKRLLVMTPAFVTDCLETLEEIAVEGKEDFLHAGGEWFQHIPCLNDQPPYIDFLAGRVRAWLGGRKSVAVQAGQRAQTLASAE
ncbi:MAG: ferrochelatase [Opitutaceae bacterium]|jgi:ferrochelatase